tara:strand:+ start:379 stop:1023 length:645 start_codon:yes stop_codon:yes gene_type:complete
MQIVLFLLITKYFYFLDPFLPKIIDRPISFDEQRIKLTLEYLASHYGIIQEYPTILPRMVVVHWTAIPTMEATFNTFNPSTLSNNRSDIQSAGALNVSSQFLVDTDGTIYRLMPETTMARHVIGLNHCAIGIENVGPGADGKLTLAQLESNVILINYLQKKYPIKFVIGHYEYQNFVGHPLWLEKDAGYRTEKVDPGIEFMEALRKQIGLLKDY